MKLEPGGDNGRYSTSPRKEAEKKKPEKKDNDRQNPPAAEPDPAGTIDRGTAPSEHRRNFYGFASRD